MSEPFDVVVVGAGPAGSAAAIVLGRAGLRVALLDRRAFPREKPCGDLIGRRAVRAAMRLGVPAAALADFRRIRGVVLTTPSDPLELALESAPGSYAQDEGDARIIPRSHFDELLMRTAVREGAIVRQATVRTVGEWTGRGRFVSAHGPNGFASLAARAVIVAGGYGCRVAADVTPGEEDRRAPRGIAMRGYMRAVNCPPDRVVFALDRWLLPGYGWIFPLPAGRANVGVGTLVDARGASRHDAHLHELWQRFVTDSRSPVWRWLADAKMDGEPRTWPLDLGPRRRRLAADGLLAAGEAAGLVGPLTGAGIAFALESGERAGSVLAAALTDGQATVDRLRPYTRALRRRVEPWLRVELLAQRFLSDADRAERFFDLLRHAPAAGPLGARLLLQLG